MNNKIDEELGIFVARFQTWESGGEKHFANKVFSNQCDAEADMKRAEKSAATTEYREFDSEAEAWAWLQEEEDYYNN